MFNTITVVIPTIPPREHMLREAISSVTSQTMPCNSLVMLDVEHAGAPATRDKGLRLVETPWVAFLDDDDLFKPYHLEHLLAHAYQTDADYVFSWFETLPNGSDPFPSSSHYEAPWDPENPRQTTITTLVRTELAQEVGFLGDRTDTGDGMTAGEDWAFTLGCNRLGKISHLVEKTWYWRHWGFGGPGRPGNTSGLGTRW